MLYSQQVQTKKKTQKTETETDGERERERETNVTHRNHQNEIKSYKNTYMIAPHCYSILNFFPPTFKTYNIIN